MKASFCGSPEPIKFSGIFQVKCSTTDSLKLAIMGLFTPWKWANITHQSFSSPTLIASLLAYHWLQTWQVTARKGDRVFPFNHNASCGGWGWAEGDSHLCPWRLDPGSHLLPLCFHWIGLPCLLVNYCQEVKKDTWKITLLELGIPSALYDAKVRKKRPEILRIDNPKPASKRLPVTLTGSLIEAFPRYHNHLFVHL